MARGEAHLYDGLTSARHDVSVRLSEDKQFLCIDGPSLTEPLQWRLSDLRALDDHADPNTMIVTRHLATDDESPRDPARMVIEDADLIAWLRRTRPRLGKRDMHSGTGRKVLWGSVGAIGAVALMIFVILPAMADTLARLLPVEQEIAMGRSVTAQMERFLGGRDIGELRCDAPEGRAALDKMMARLTDGVDLEYDLDIAVYDHKMMNAFAAPGGQMVIVRGLLDKADSPEMVAAVLAHEIGHVVHRDPTRNALRAAGSVGLLSLLIGDFTGGAVMVALADQAINASYSQEAEINADLFAHEMLATAELPPSALAEMFETFREEAGDVSGPMAHFASHPRLATRIEAANAADAGVSGAPVLTETEWRALRNICEGRDKRKEDAEAQGDDA